MKFGLKEYTFSKDFIISTGQKTFISGKNKELEYIVETQGHNSQLQLRLPRHTTLIGAKEFHDDLRNKVPLLYDRFEPNETWYWEVPEISKEEFEITYSELKHFINFSYLPTFAGIFSAVPFGLSAISLMPFHPIAATGLVAIAGILGGSDVVLSPHWYNYRAKSNFDLHHFAKQVKRKAEHRDLSQLEKQIISTDNMGSFDIEEIARLYMERKEIHQKYLKYEGLVSLGFDLRKRNPGKVIEFKGSLEEVDNIFYALDIGMPLLEEQETHEAFKHAEIVTKEVELFERIKPLVSKAYGKRKESEVLLNKIHKPRQEQDEKELKKIKAQYDQNRKWFSELREHKQTLQTYQEEKKQLHTIKQMEKSLVEIKVKKTAEKGVYTGKEVDGFKISQKLGQGGIGQVYLARKDFEKFAIKFPLTDCEESRQALLEDAYSQESVKDLIQHPRLLLKINQVDPDAPYLVSKFIEGLTLDRLLKHDNSDTVLKLNVFRDVAKLLQKVHHYGVVHRDLKPSNIMVGKTGEIYLVDFGSAVNYSGKNTLLSASLKTKHSAITPKYVSPEEANPDIFDRSLEDRKDIYKLGAIMKEVLVGSNGVGNLLERMCAYTPSKRPKITTVFQELQRAVKKHGEVNISIEYIS